MEEAGWTCSGFGPGLCSQDSVCGNGLIETPPENCDDGNSDSNDGCSDDCLEELGFTCEDEPSVCTIFCGDSLKVGPETCDVTMEIKMLLMDALLNAKQRIDGHVPAQVLAVALLFVEMALD